MKLQLSETGNLFDAVVQFLLIFLLVFKMVPMIFAFFFYQLLGCDFLCNVRCLSHMRYDKKVSLGLKCSDITAHISKSLRLIHLISNAAWCFS